MKLSAAGENRISKHKRTHKSSKSEHDLLYTEHQTRPAGGVDVGNEAGAWLLGHVEVANVSMGWTSLKVSYFVLAPMSVVAGAVLIALYGRVKELRRQPGWLVLWQCIAQTLLDLHWLSSTDILSHR